MDSSYKASSINAFISVYQFNNSDQIFHKMIRPLTVIVYGDIEEEGRENSLQRDATLPH